MTYEEFAARWGEGGGAERANKDSFLGELCDVLGVERPRPKTGDPAADAYVFEKNLSRARPGGSTSVFVDLYKEGCFVLEAKQGATSGPKRRGSPAWNQMMVEAHGQALGYAGSLASPPPFLLVCDVGYCFDVYASFDGTGTYRAFPDGLRRRLFVADLAGHAELLRAIWTDPHSLDPSRRSAAVTREIAGQIAELARARAGRARFGGGRDVLDALPVHDVRRGRGAAAQGHVLGVSRAVLAAEPGELPGRHRLALAGDGPRRGFLDRPPAPLLRRALRVVGGAAVVARAARAAVVGREERLVAGRSVDLRHVARARLEPAGAPPPGRALHAARLRRAPGAADDRRAVAGGLGFGARRGAAAGRGGQGGGRAEAGARVPPCAVPGEGARSGVRYGELLVRDARSLQAARDGGAGPPRGARLSADQPRDGDLPGDAGAVSRPGGEALGEGDRGAGVVDRLPAVAGAPAGRRADGAGAGALELREH